MPVGAFRIVVVPPNGGSALPLNSVNIVGPGEKIRYEPVKLSDDLKSKTRVSLILVPAVKDGEKHLYVLPAQPVVKPAEWTVPARIAAVGVVFGPNGVDTKKVASMVEKHPEIVTRLANYAEESSRVEAMVQTLSDYEDSAPGSVGLQGLMQGFSTQYGVQLPTLDPKSAASDQALALVRALAPAVASNDPLSDRGSMLAKTSGLAGSLAASYFGAPVALAIGGAQLADNLRTALFPPTDFRSAFAERENDGVNLCTAKVANSKTRVRLNYVWMVRVPNQDPPQLSLTDEPHVALGTSPTITLTARTVAQLKLASQARDWQLVENGRASPIPVAFKVGAENDQATLDLAHARLAPGEYQLAARWDWSPLDVAGHVDIRAPGNMANAQLTPESQDALLAGQGTVPVQLTGTDFEFVDSVSLLSADSKQHKKSSATALEFTLPKGESQGEQTTMQVEVDTSALHPGPYLLAVRQTNGSVEDVTIRVHPPNPEIEAAIRVNVGEPGQTVELHGKGLERIQKIESDLATWSLQPVASGDEDASVRRATVKLNPKSHPGDKLAADIFVAGLLHPLHVADVLSVAGPRPKILSLSASLPAQSGVQLRDGEIPAGQPASFAIQVKNLGAQPRLALACRNTGDTRHAIELVPGDKTGSAQLDVTGEGELFLSVDPASVGESGCQLIAQVTDPSTGTSDPYALGEVVRLPHIDKLLITDQSLGNGAYAGTLTGESLQLIAKTGWSENAGNPVQSIPTADTGNPQQQTLKIAVPWPPPSPQAPLYVWLRGETHARQTNARY